MTPQTPKQTPNRWLDPSAGATDGLTIELVAFSLRGLRFAVDATQVRGMTEVNDPSAPALADLLGLGRTHLPMPPGRERLLRLRLASQSGDATLEVRIEEPLSLQRLPASRLHPLPDLMAATSVLPCVWGLVRLGDPGTDDLTILLDTRRLPR